MDGREVVVTRDESSIFNLVLGYFANTISKPSSCIHTSLQSSLTPMVMVEVMMMMLLFGFILYFCLEHTLTFSHVWRFICTLAFSMHCA